jgi:hypothetical protein
MTARACSVTSFQCRPWYACTETFALTCINAPSARRPSSAVVVGPGRLRVLPKRPSSRRRVRSTSRRVAPVMPTTNTAVYEAKRAGGHRPPLTFGTPAGGKCPLPPAERTTTFDGNGHHHPGPSLPPLLYFPVAGLNFLSTLRDPFISLNNGKLEHVRAKPIHQCSQRRGQVEQWQSIALNTAKRTNAKRAQMIMRLERRWFLDILKSEVRKVIHHRTLRRSASKRTSTH